MHIINIVLQRPISHVCISNESLYMPQAFAKLISGLYAHALSSHSVCHYLYTYASNFLEKYKNHVNLCRSLMIIITLGP